MESDRARVPQVPAESRDQVLRDGIHHLDRLAPYDDGPEELTTQEQLEYLLDSFAKKYIGSARRVGKSLRDYSDQMRVYIDDEPRSTHDSGSVFDFSTEPVDTFRQPRVKRPKKKNAEPYYVKLTKPRRR